MPISKVPSLILSIISLACKKMPSMSLLFFIPCHRVIRSSGLMGGFSAKGGVNLKNKILKFEQLNK